MSDFAGLVPAEIENRITTEEVFDDNFNASR